MTDAQTGPSRAALVGRSLLNFSLGGALLGVATVTLLAPRMLGWWNEPGSGKALCDCADLTRQTAERLISSQAYGLVGGALLGLLAGVVLVWRRRTKKLPAPAAP